MLALGLWGAEAAGAQAAAGAAPPARCECLARILDRGGRHAGAALA
jgi:hypothetical protein